MRIIFYFCILAAMQAGMQMAQQMMQSNPDAVEEMRKEFMKQMGGGQK